MVMFYYICKKVGIPHPPVSMPIDSIPLEIIRYPNIKFIMNFAIEFHGER